MSDGAHDPWTRWAASIAALLLGVLLVMFIMAALRAPSTSERLSRVEDQLTVVTCLLLIPDEEREARGIAECQLQGD